MAIEDHYTIPSSASELPLNHDEADKLFICFVASTDPATQQPWCSDVHAALPRLEETFSSLDVPRLKYVHVGQKPEWKDLNNKYRKDWGINAVPTLVCYQRINGKVEAANRLVEGELIDDAKLSGFVAQ